jgi:hypothetical protein
MFLALLLVEYAIPGPASLASINPHPFCLPVLLLSAQYGTVSGLTAAMAAIALSWIAGWPAQNFGEDFYAYSLRLWHQPMLWLGAAVLLGELRNRHIRERNALREQLAGTDAQRQSIAQLCGQLQIDNETLRRRIACSQNQSIAAGLGTLTTLRHATAATAADALAEAVRLLIGPSKYVVLAWRDGGFAVLLESAGGQSQRSSAERRCGIALRDAVLRDRRFLSVLREDDASVLDGVGVLAGPIVLPNSGATLGVLLVEEASATSLHEESETALRAICAELSPVLMASEIVILHHERAAVRNQQLETEHKMPTERTLALRSGDQSLHRRAGSHGQ